MYLLATRKKIKVAEDICGQAIKPGGQADLDFVNKMILPYYISQKWLTKGPPKGMKCLDCTTLTLLILLVQAGKRRGTRLSPSATKIHTTTVMQNCVKMWGIVSKAWQVA